MKEDLTGKVFGRLTVLESSDRRYKDGTKLWKCRCECGNIKHLLGRELKKGTTKSCGCLKKELASKKFLHDLTGKKFGKLTVIERADDYILKSGNKEPCWKCRCECGSATIVLAHNLKNGTTKSCGCLKKHEDLIGKKFGKLIVLGFEYEKNGQYFEKCRCECGNIAVVNSTSLKRGLTKSCGCIRNESSTKTAKKMFVADTNIYIPLGKRKLNKNNTSGYTGVTKKQNGKWVAYITFQKKRYYLLEDYDINIAIAARKEAEQNLYSNFLEWYAQTYPERLNKIKNK